MKNKKSEKKQWDLPVSIAFYEKLKAKTALILRDLGHLQSWLPLIMGQFERYMRNGETASHIYDDDLRLIIFFSLRQEIDEAMRRSALSRKRAAERRERKEAEKSALKDQTSVDIAPACTAETDSASDAETRGKSCQSKQSKAIGKGSLHPVQTNGCNSNVVTEKKKQVHSRITHDDVRSISG